MLCLYLYCCFLLDIHTWDYKLMLTVSPVGSPLEYYFQRKQNVPQRTRPCLFLAEL